jgi:hypothetical protein
MKVSKVLTTAIALTAATSVCHAGLLISEYIEGSATNKAIEVYNAGPGSVDQTQVTLELYSNGSATATATTALSAGTLAVGSVWVLYNSGAALPGITSQGDQVANTVVNWNGDDAVVLKLNGVIQDSIGQVGLDPGTEWNVGGVSTLNMTLVRKNTTPDANTADAYDPSVYFNAFAIDTTTDLGIGTVPVTMSGFTVE